MISFFLTVMPLMYKKFHRLVPLMSQRFHSKTSYFFHIILNQLVPHSIRKWCKFAVLRCCVLRWCRYFSIVQIKHFEFGDNLIDEPELISFILNNWPAPIFHNSIAKISFSNTDFRFICMHYDYIMFSHNQLSSLIKLSVSCQLILPCNFTKKKFILPILL